ncbi:MAG: biotin/lipoyl-binding protein [Vampirovibrionales bacterium]|nr:biotin/lipoyl-binding protein [Vampirovibrionales bacterium]
MDNDKNDYITRSVTLQRIRGTGGFRAVAATFLALMAVILACLVLVPWQQSISGTGKVTVYTPMDRPQTVEALISSRIEQWHVGEGQFVKKGQLLLELSEIDPKYLDPGQLKRMELQREALLARQDATLARIESLKTQVGFLSQSRSAAVPSARAKVFQSRNKMTAASQAVTAAKQNQTTAKLNLKRIQELHEKGLRSTRDLELAEQSHIEAQTKVEQAQAYLDVAQQDQSVATFDEAKVTADTSASLSSTQASISTAYETLASTQNDLAKLDVEIGSLKQRISQRKIRAPRDGILVRILSVGPGETVSEGDILATLMPRTADQAVELLVSDNDSPLVAVGRPVRLQFAGWPALQFSGWPSVAVGTFAGRVSVVDAIDDGTGRYRIWVLPDTKAIQNRKEQPWPSLQYLRPGSKAVGWVMLDTVPLWFELWRQFNAFPPTVNPEPVNGFLEGKAQDEKGDPKESIKKPKKK